MFWGCGVFFWDPREEKLDEVLFLGSEGDERHLGSLWGAQPGPGLRAESGLRAPTGGMSEALGSLA